MKVTVVGVGVGGLAVAGHAALVGNEVAVHDVREEAVAPVAERGGIEVRGKEQGFAPVAVATTDLARAMKDAELVVIVTQGPDQRAAAAAMAPHLGPGQVVLVKPGCTFGAVEVAAVIDAGGSGDVAVAETDSFAYGCAIPEPGVSSITSVKQRFGVAVLPVGRTEQVVGLVRALFDQAEPAPSVLHTGLSNMNAILHVAPMVLNAGRIESPQETFDFYGDGITPAVARAVEAMDDERVAVAAALDVEVPTLRGWVRATYGVDGDDLYGIVQTLHRDVYGPLPAPATLRQRYLTEDVPCGAVPVAELGRAIAVPTPVADACIRVADALTDSSWGTEGRTLERLGLSGLSRTEIRQRLAG
jgi:opine dehydrogenase